MQIKFCGGFRSRVLVFVGCLTGRINKVGGFDATRALSFGRSVWPTGFQGSFAVQAELLEKISVLNPQVVPFFFCRLPLFPPGISTVCPPLNKNDSEWQVFKQTIFSSRRLLCAVLKFSTQVCDIDYNLAQSVCLFPKAKTIRRQHERKPWKIWRLLYWSLEFAVMKICVEEDWLSPSQNARKIVFYWPTCVHGKSSRSSMAKTAL